MKISFTTFCATSLMWSLALLYGFCTGHISRPEPDFATALSEAAQPVKLVRR